MGKTRRKRSHDQASRSGSIRPKSEESAHRKVPKADARSFRSLLRSDTQARVKAWAKAIIGPTSPPGKYPQLINAPGSETGPGQQLVTWGKSTILSVDAHSLKFEYTLNSAKHIPFDWVGR
jgi:hypothetical protein